MLSHTLRVHALTSSHWGFADGVSFFRMQFQHVLPASPVTAPYMNSLSTTCLPSPLQFRPTPHSNACCLQCLVETGVALAVPGLGVLAEPGMVMPVSVVCA